MPQPLRHLRTWTVLMLPAVLVAVLATACVGSGKIARTESILPLPPGMRIVSDTTSGCREGESGYDYRFVVLGPTKDLGQGGPLMTALRQRDFYHSIVLPDDRHWVTIGYQHSRIPLRLEIGWLDGYLADPRPYSGPNPATLPAEVRDHADEYVLIAMRPTDFACTTPL